MLNTNSTAGRSHIHHGRPAHRPEDGQAATQPQSATAPPSGSPQTPQDTYVPETRETEEQGASSNFSQLLGGLGRNFPAPNEAEDRNGNSSPAGVSMVRSLSSPLPTGMGAGSPYDDNATQPIPVGGGYTSTNMSGTGPAGPGEVGIIRLPGY